ncbi:UNVERIFIED_CONTAM: Retrovirus-related Pol polyprotein from transposon RE1 [Sesamum radiatum]|uniref:Retrovirus-related Pol polyprotein from transposon RE1 n=1 Tax=Sesamum radiatum TaxID=300843 RepID=A0AAW2S643_SESRA
MLPPDGSSIQSWKVSNGLYMGLSKPLGNGIKINLLLGYSFTQSPHENCLFIKHSTAGLLIFLVYVDDVLLTGPSEHQILDVKWFLDLEFTIKDMGLAKYFLGLEIAQCVAGLSITQHKYVQNIFQDTGLTSCRPASTHLPLAVKLSSHDTAALQDPSPYRYLVGRLLHLSFTRSDIVFCAQQLCQFVHQPGQVHMDATLHLVRYLKGNLEQGLFFPCSNSLHLIAFCDADWAGCVDFERSLTGYFIFLGDAFISWKTKKQLIVARSTDEAEYRSLATTICELQWISCLLHDLRVFPPTLISVYYDNQAAIHIVANPIFHEQTKHIEIDCHLVRYKCKFCFILPTHVSNKFQLVDVFMKQLPVSALWPFLSKLGLVFHSQIQIRGDVENACLQFSYSTQSVITRI